MPYYDYRSYFNELVTNSETIISNQDIIIYNQKALSIKIDLLIFIVVLILILSIVRKIFRN